MHTAIPDSLDLDRLGGRFEARWGIEMECAGTNGRAEKKGEGLIPTGKKFSLCLLVSVSDGPRYKYRRFYSNILQNAPH